MSFLAVVLGASAVIAVFVWAIGGVKATIYTNPVDIEFHVPELPEIAPANADFAVIATVHGEKPADYLKRVNEAKDKTALLVIAPKHAPVWMVETPTETAAIDRTKGSEQFGVDPVPFPQIENENEYRRGLASVFSGALAYFGTNNRIAERVAASHDPLMEVVKQTAFCFALLFSGLPVFAQNNSAQALDYLGANYEKTKPSGEVAFHYAKLSVKVKGDAQKTFADLLTHSTGFDDAGKWGALQVVTVDGMAIARQAKAAPVATKDEKPKGESARPLTQKSADAMGSMKTYFSTAETERRISEREIAADRFSREYGENIRKEVTSILWIGFGWMFFALLLIGLVFWAAAKIAANESAIFSNGIPIFGTIQNWVHGWSAGVLFVIVLFYVVVYIIYSTLAWIFPIQSPFISIPLTIANAAAAVSIGHRIIPNKRVRGGQNFSGGNAPGQRQLGA